MVKPSDIDSMYKTYGNPDLVIHLRCDTDELLKRIKKRGRDFEQGHTAEFMMPLATASRRLLQIFKGTGSLPGL